MATSKTDIANAALIRIGSSRIMNIDDETSKGAVLCKVLYRDTLAEVARSGEWNSLKQRTTLARLSVNPAFGWSFQYQLPADFVDLVQLNGTRCYRVPVDDWEIEGRLLLTNAEVAQVQYIALLDDPTSYDPLFSDALTVLLASKMATAMRQDDAMASGFLTEYLRFKLPKALMKDGNQQRRRQFNPAEGSRFIGARFNSTRG